MNEKELLKIINEIEEKGQEELQYAGYAGYEAETQHGYGMMDAIEELKSKLNIKE